MKSSLDELFLAPETYTLSISLKYQLIARKHIDSEGILLNKPIFSYNYNIELKIGTYLINQQMEVYKVNRSFPLIDKEEGYWIFNPIVNYINDWIAYLLNRDYQIDSEYLLINKLPNQVYDIQAIFINIPKINGIIYESSLIFDVNLKGFRYFI